MRPAILLAAGVLAACLPQAGSTQLLPGPAPSVPSPSGATLAQRATVLSIDSVSMNFVCAERNSIRRYWLTAATGFRSGAQNATFFDLRTGEPVQVTFHRAGPLNVADLVVF